jgi:hypothetical protein
MSYQNIYNDMYEYISSNETLNSTLYTVSTAMLDGVSICAEKGSSILADVGEKVKQFNNANKTKKRLRDLLGDTFPYDKINILNSDTKIYIVFPKNMEIRTTPINSTLMWSVKMHGVPGIFSIPQSHGVGEMIKQTDVYFLDITDYVVGKGMTGYETNPNASTNNTSSIGEHESDDIDNSLEDQVIDMDDD